MYEDYFGFSKRPFTSVPQADRYYPAAAIEAARQTLVRCIQRAEGLGLIVGPSGTGKTLLCRVLAERFKDCFEVVLLSSGRLSTRRALLQAILFGMGRPYRGMDEGELRLAMVDHLTAGDDCPQGMLLLVDEAHTLPLRLLEEIRMVTNLVCGGQPRVRLVLAGGSVLEERFASPKLDCFNQRIVARCYLESFTGEETEGYIHAQIKWAGGAGPEVMPLDACRAVYQATDGVPRLINQLCDHALLLACAGGRQEVDRAAVEEAWADLQQLPTPWNADVADEKSDAGIIEFGGLENASEEGERAGSSGGLKGPRRPSVPILRISPESDQASDDPLKQLERIQQTISGLDDDFEPAGSIGPEMELVFDDAKDPFSERFAEEELIIDRFQQPPGTDMDGQSRPFAHPAADGRRGAGAHETQAASAEHETEATEMAAAGQTAQKGLQADEAAQAPAAETDDQKAPAESDAVPETVPLHPRRPGQKIEADGHPEPDEPLEPEEEEMIIVEEGYEPMPPIHTRPAAAVRRLEYGRLFARLRRSC